MGLIDKVMQGLECHKDEIPGVCRDCPYFTETGFCSGRLAKDALKVLDSREAMPVVRCRDCKWFDGEICEVYGRHTENFFCADGVKRE